MSRLLDLRFIEPEKLFLAWYLLFYHRQGVWVENYLEYHKEKCVKLKSGARNCLTDETTRRLLYELYEQGIINCINVWHGVSDLELNIRPDADEEKSDWGMYYQKTFGDRDFDLKIFHEYDFNLGIDEMRTVGFIVGYLKDWRTGNLHLPGNRNILKPEKQLEKVVKRLFQTIENHFPQHFLFEEQKKEEGDLDFVATVLFLHSIGDLEILGFLYEEDFEEYDNVQKVPIHFRLSLTDKFYEDFSYDWENVTVRFDFNELSANEQRQVIYFDSPYRLWTAEANKRLYRGRFPYELLSAAFTGTMIEPVLIANLLKPTGLQEKDIGEAVSNFRKGLRKTFGFPEMEEFCSVKDGKIFLDPRIFKKREKTQNNQ